MALQKYPKNLEPAIGRAVDRIIDDHRSGATMLALNTLRVIARTASSLKDHRRSELRSIMMFIVNNIIRAHPQMGILYYVRKRLTRERRITERGIRQLAFDLEAMIGAQQDGNAAALAKKVRPRWTVVTTSYSSSVARALTQAGKSGIRIIVSESRPKGEGHLLAWYLRDAGMEVTLVVDAALGLHIPRAQAVVLGADAVMPGYFVNKIGSYALCLLAREHDVPVYVLTDTFRLVGKNVVPRKQIGHPAREVIRQPQPYAIDNRYFDFVPLDLVGTIIAAGECHTPQDLFT
jgi:translation initiation factor 2B subunit (eIF-2B alpha/beta/delta family)